MRDRAILHSDANCFYASVETVLNPEFRGKAIAVCGSPEERHGIVLAKSEKAKRAGVKTGMANWQAKQCCRDLIIVPPQYDYYLKFSKLLHGIYRRYTDQVEPFGMDECWLDVTYSPGDPMKIAEEIRQAVKDELGLTVSIGVSFNKVFAKLGSDYKKPDAITQISKEHFKEIVWPLPCSDLLYCGNAMTAKLGSMGVRTIGGIASLPVEVMQRKFGKNGVALWKYANGLDDSRVAHQDYTAPAKSVGHGITCVADLENMDEARKVIFALSLDIGYKLRYMNLRATGVQLYVRNSELSFCSWQKRLEMATQDEGTIALAAYSLLEEKYSWRNPIRSITVTAIQLDSSQNPTQLSMLLDYERLVRREKLNESIDTIRDRYGKYAVIPALVLDEKKMPVGNDREIIMPGYMYQ
ncbi:MAG: DNA polymerase thumb domain-containing protein [Faecousia sp.]